jgi:hypothetical protein
LPLEKDEAYPAISVTAEDEKGTAKEACSAINATAEGEKSAPARAKATKAGWTEKEEET